MSNIYVCANCREVFAKEEDWTDEAAKQEYEKNFGVEYSKNDRTLVCDDCYKQILAKYQEDQVRKKKEHDDWLASLSPTGRTLAKILERTLIQSIVNDIIGPIPPK